MKRSARQSAFRCPRPSNAAPGGAAAAAHFWSACLGIAAGFIQCHYFAGIGVWSSALRLAGWPDDRPVWTGYCPCQPFSQAGKGAGFADARHLWPARHNLISECRPPVIFGEQLVSKDVDPWIDLVFDDLEAMEYAGAANPFPSAGVGAPHIRDRTFFVAYANDARSQRRKRVQERAAECVARARGVAGIVADSDHQRLGGVDALLLGVQGARVASGLAEAAGRRKLASWPTPQTLDSTGGGQGNGRRARRRTDRI
nr:DNA cytosine methyltransferase [Paraburkholderia fynbosensis]